MDIESLKKIESTRNIRWEKPGSFFSQKRKKAKPQNNKEEKNKNKIDVRA